MDKNNNGDPTPLHLILSTDEVGKVEDLLAAGANVGAPGVFRTLPLHYAEWELYASVVATLLRHEADVLAAINYGDTALHEAVDNGMSERVTLLLQHGANVDAVTVEDETPLHIAARYGCPVALNALLNHGAKPNRLANGFAPLHLSAWRSLAEGL